MLLTKFWKISTLFAVGVSAGLIYLLVARSADPAPVSNLDQRPGRFAAENLSASGDASSFANPDGQEVQAHAEEDPLVKFAELVQEGDALLEAARFSAAALRYQAAQRVGGYMTCGLALRMGLCAEFDHQPAIATRHYRRVLELRPTENVRWLARLGLCRTWLETGNFTEALPVLCDLYIDVMNSPRTHREVHAQVHYALASAVRNVVLRDQNHELSHWQCVAFHDAAPRIDRTLTLLANEPPSMAPFPLQGGHEMPSVNGSNDVDSRPIQFVVVQRPTDSVEMMFLDVDTPLAPVAQLMSHLAAACQLELLVTPAAKLALRGRSKALQQQDASASMLLDCLLIPLNVCWFQEGNQIHLISVDETPALTAQYWTLVMERMYRRFNIAFPGDYRNGAVLLSRANLMFMRGDLDRAALHYQELTQMDPSDELLAKLFFNSAKTELRLGRSELAIQRFYLAIDQSYDVGIQASAYWHIAQLNLESNQLADAIKASGRALSLARTDTLKRLAAMTMTRAYLLSNQPLSANQVLFEQRHVLQGSPHEPAAAMLGSFARYVAMTDLHNRRSESNRLLAAIATARDEHYESFLDFYLAARAWQELGFRDKAIEKLKLAADYTTIMVWRRQFQYELAIQWIQAQEFDQAMPLLEELIASESDTWRDKAQWQLAAIRLQRHQPTDCLALCEELLPRSITEDDKKNILDLMGRSYRLLGQHHSAALCFAGVIPIGSWAPTH